ncbi:YqgE/AlgH family protein [Rufibacter roseus]|uniref:YqgE/AlgH family protein n=1 Tax=Rufibacter roseus TaxID=1567108 RepID=A0ABW2DT38_9BACT|nr:YqgE/AlgH family protein [Rufibacter roseus]
MAKDIQNGSILISEPFLGDPNFERSVVVICQHDTDGTVGLVLNRISNLFLSDVVEVNQQVFDMALAVGGPMQPNTLHYIHRLPNLTDAQPISTELFWGGDFEELTTMLNSGLVSEDEIRFFVGYSGWSPGQLEEEIEKNVWFVNNNAANKLLTLNTDTLWRDILREMGGKYKMYANYPADPSLN